MLVQAVTHALGRGIDGAADVDGSEIELHRPGIDGGEIEDVVDDGQQRAARGRDVAEIFELLVGQRPGGEVMQEMREADDVGERRAQLVGYVVDEVVLELVGRLQRIVAVTQCPLDIDGIGHVLEADQRRPVGKRDGRAIENAAVDAFEAGGDRGAILHPHHGAEKMAPEFGVAKQRLAGFDDALDMRPRLQLRRREPPHAHHRRIGQPQPAIAAEHGDRLGEILQRLALHPDQ